MSNLIQTLKEIRKDLEETFMKTRAFLCIKDDLCFVSLKKLDPNASTQLFNSSAGCMVGVNNEYIKFK